MLKKVSDYRKLVKKVLVTQEDVLMIKTASLEDKIDYKMNQYDESNESFSCYYLHLSKAFEEVLCHFVDQITMFNLVRLTRGGNENLQERIRVRIISNSLFEFDESFKSSNVNPLFEENDKDVEIKFSSSITLKENVSIPPGIDLNLPTILEVLSSNPTSPTLTGEKVCSWKTPMFFSLVRFVWKMMTRIAIRKKIMCILATFLHKKPKTLSFPKEVEEIKENEKEVSSDVPIHTIVMPIRITFDNPIDFNDHFSKPKDLKKDLTISFYSDLIHK
ncbi:hypothetical protein Tco_0805517 [Tanacetum coccineum]